VEPYTTVYLALTGASPPPKPRRGDLEEAARNKVLLEYMRVTGYHGLWRDRQEEMRRRLVESIAEVEAVLGERVEHVYIKTCKPVAYVPSDIDMLAPPHGAAEAARLLARRGWRLAALDHYTVTMARRGVVLDIYTSLTLADTVYLDARLIDMRRDTETCMLDDTPIPAPRRPLEAAIDTAHAVYKERLYTLNDHLTLTRIGIGAAAEAARRLRVEGAVRHAALLASMAAKGLRLPRHIDPPHWILLHASKTLRDPAYRATLGNTLRRILTRTAGGTILHRLRRQTY